MIVKKIDSRLTHTLRHRVLWPHIGQEQDCVIDIDNNEDAIHLAVFDGDVIRSVGSLFRTPSEKIPHKNQYRLRAMATDPDFRGRHAGAHLIENAKSMLFDMGVEALWCDARLSATGFYMKLGFHLVEEIYEVRNIGPHQFMWIELQPAPINNQAT